MATRGLEVCQRWEVPVHRPWLAATLGYANALSGQVSEGLTLLKEAVNEAEKSGLVASQAWRLAWLSEALLLADRPDDSVRCADLALEQARRHGERGHEAWALRAQAEVAAARKPFARDAARVRYQEALMLAEALGMRPLEARCHLGLAALHRTAGRHEQARAVLDRAVEPLQSMGMAFWITRARTPGRVGKRARDRA
jgi:tetratricopeptide (TPR) repeat protein